MKVFKNYWLFTSVKYRIYALLLFPLFWICAEIYLGMNMSENAGLYMGIQILVYIVMTNVLEDYWLFGGICAKGENCANFLKTSYLGMRFMRGGLLGDMLRRAIYFVVYGMVASVAFREIYFIVASLIAYLAVIIILNCTRHMSTFQGYMIMGVAAAFIAAVIIGITLFIWMAMESKMVWAIESIVVLVLCVAVTAISLMHMMHCIRKEAKE